MYKISFLESSWKFGTQSFLIYPHVLIYDNKYVQQNVNVIYDSLQKEIKE